MHVPRLVTGFFERLFHFSGQAPFGRIQFAQSCCLVKYCSVFRRHVFNIQASMSAEDMSVIDILLAPLQGGNDVIHGEGSFRFAGLIGQLNKCLDRSQLAIGIQCTAAVKSPLLTREVALRNTAFCDVPQPHKIGARAAR